VTTPVVLVVEDNPLHQRILTLLLEPAGVSTHVVPSGVEALQLLSTGGRYAAVLMDWKMPQLDGLECTRRIRELEASEGIRIPIIALTAHAIVGAREECLAAGMDDYLSKPFTGDSLRQTVLRWLPVPSEQSCRHEARVEKGLAVRRPRPGTLVGQH